VNGAVGNDIVDLGEPGARDRHEDASFVRRVCSDDERARVETARDLWEVFAAKEAAYKVLAKLAGATSFAPRRIRVARERDSVVWSGSTGSDVGLALRVTGDGDHVHALAWWGPTVPTVALACRRASEDESERARGLLCRLVARDAGLDVGALCVVRDRAPHAWDGFGPPRIELRGRPLGSDVSLSHDGRFVAAAVVAVHGAASELRALRPRAHCLPGRP
jgi:phosphopantetheinyl transferase (holo-ACP synthase)